MKLLRISNGPANPPKLAEITQKDVEAIASPITSAKNVSSILARNSSTEFSRNLKKWQESLDKDQKKSLRPKTKIIVAASKKMEDNRKTWTFFVDKSALPPPIPEKPLAFKKRQIEKLLMGEIRPIIGPINHKEIRALLIPINNKLKKSAKNQQMDMETYDTPNSYY